MGSLRRGGANGEKKGGGFEKGRVEGGVQILCLIRFFLLTRFYVLLFSGFVESSGDLWGVLTCSRLFSCFLGAFGAFSNVLGFSRLFSQLVR